MFFDKLTQLLSSAFRPKPKYFTVTPVAASGPVAALPPSTMPRHVAIIMDGNGRWAKQRNLPRSAGHAAGTEALRDIIRASDDWGIEALSLYAFSTENWARSKDEVDALMSLLLKYFASEIDELDAKNVRITILGDVDGLPAPQREAVCKAMDRTRNNDGLKLNIALNYGGRAELTRAARILAQQVRDGVIDPEDIDEAMFAEELYTADSPDVDLLIRTSGEQRTSNFLPWQLTYAEFVFDNTYWPDFNRERYMRCLREYAGRERRFGREDAAPEPAKTPEAAAPEAPPAVPEDEADEDVVLEINPVIDEPEISPEAEPDEDVVLEIKPVIDEPEISPEYVPDEDVVLEIKPVTDEPESLPETEADEDVVLEIKPVIDEPEISPEAEPDEDVVLNVTPVLDAPERAAEDPGDGDDVVLEIRPVTFPAESPAAEATPSPAPEAVPEDFVLEIKPVLSGRTAPAVPDAEALRVKPAAGQDADAPARKAKGRNRRSRSKRARNAGSGAPSATDKE